MNSDISRAESMSSVRYGAASSRRLLIDAIKALSVFGDAITVVGAHAVHVWVQNAWGRIDMEATRDSDITINPSFVAEDPKIIEMLKAIGVEPALSNRPGIYGLIDETGFPLQARTTFDILVPEVYAGTGRRAARIPGQNNAATRAIGLELVLWDRHMFNLETFDEPNESVVAYIAGPASLLVAKIHKVHERWEQRATSPERLRPKDSGDIALLMMVSDANEVADIMRRNALEHPEISQVVRSAAQWLSLLYGNLPSAPITRQHAAISLAARFNEVDVLKSIDTWLESFSFYESMGSWIHNAIITFTRFSPQLEIQAEEAANQPPLHNPPLYYLSQ